MGATLSVEDQFEGDERALLKRIQELLDVRMKDKRKRYVHSLGVAETALHLAEVYGVDRFDAAAAGLIHDWARCPRASLWHQGCRLSFRRDAAFAWPCCRL